MERATKRVDLSLLSRDLIAGGANAVQQYLAAGLLDELQIHVVPVLLGGGVRLFADGAAAVGLENIRAIQSPSVTHLKYRVLK